MISYCMQTSCIDCGKNMGFTKNQEFASICCDCSRKRKLIKALEDRIKNIEKRITENEKRSPHPWQAFLDARYHAIIWMKDELGYADITIAQQLSMDENQVYLIITSKRMPDSAPKEQ